MALVAFYGDANLAIRSIDKGRWRKNLGQEYLEAILQYLESRKVSRPNNQSMPTRT